LRQHDFYEHVYSPKAEHKLRTVIITIAKKDKTQNQNNTVKQKNMIAHRTSKDSQT